jgi:4-carboxymuconolactone decarboxylase
VTTRDERRRRGLAILKKIDGGTGGPILAPLGEVAPAFPDFIREFVFGDVFARRKLDLKSREMAAVAALAAIGDTERQLRVHIGNALKTGCTRAEVVEVLMQTAVFAGFPRAMNALFTAREVFAELDARAARKGAKTSRIRRRPAPGR